MVDIFKSLELYFVCGRNSKNHFLLEIAKAFARFARVFLGGLLGRNMEKIKLELTQEQAAELKNWAVLGVVALRELAAYTNCVIAEENLIDRIVLLNDFLESVKAGEAAL
jgi:hypothetical protein